MIRVSCPGCKESLGVPETMAGQKVTCAKCKTIFVPTTPMAPALLPLSERSAHQSSTPLHWSLAIRAILFLAIIQVFIFFFAKTHFELISGSIETLFGVVIVFTLAYAYDRSRDTDSTRDRR